MAARHSKYIDKTQIALLRNQLFYQVTETVVNFQDITKVLQIIVDNVAEGLPASRVLLYIFNLPTKKIIHFIKGGPTSEKLAQDSFGDLWQGLTGWVIRKRKPTISEGVSDTRENPIIQQRRVQENAHYILIVPISYRNQLIGTITAINGVEGAAFTEQDMEFVGSMANQAACAIQNAQLYEQVQEYKQTLSPQTQDGVAKLRQSQKRYQDIFDNAHDLIQSVGADGCFKYVNQSWLDALEYTIEEVTNLQFIDILAPHQIEDYITTLQQLHIGQRFTNKRLVLITKTGQELIVEGNLRSRFKAGRFMAVQGILRDITERVHTEVDLRESEEKYSNLFHHSNDAIFLHNLAGTILDSNQKVLDLFGYSKSEILSLKIFDFDPSDVTGLTKIRHEKLWRQGFINFETSFEKKNGEHFPGEVSSSLLKIGGKKVIQTIIRDITERKHAETERIRFTNHLRTAADISQQLNVILDPDVLLSKVVSLLKIRFNLYYVQIYLLDEAKGELTLCVGSGHAGEILREQGYSISIKNEQSLVVRVARERKIIMLGDINTKTNFILTPLLPQTRSEMAIPLMAQNKLLGVLDLQDNIAHRFNQVDLNTFNTLAGQIGTALQNSRLYQRTVNSETKYRTLFENATDLIWTIDLKGRFTDINHAVELVTGLNKSEIIGTQFTRFILPSQKDKLIKAFNKIYKTGQALSGFPIKVLVAQGQLLDLELSVVLLWQSGTITGVQGIAHDVTQRLQLERELFRSEKLAAVGRLASSVAHEVNNPLAIMSSTIQLMMYKWTETHPDREKLQQIQEEIQRISRILRGLMSFARPQVQPATLQNLNKIIEDFISLLRHDLSKHHIKLNLQLAVDLPLIVVAEDEIKQVLFNLIGNARDAIVEDGHLIVSTQTDKHNIYLRVIDTGEGLSEIAQKRLFEPFFSTKGVSGTGLGLTIVHGIIMSYGGTVNAENNSDRGCTITISLPIHGMR